MKSEKLPPADSAAASPALLKATHSPLATDVAGAPVASIVSLSQDLKPASKRTIEILHTMFLRGPSIWTYRPALEAWVDLGELEDFPSNKLPGFPERLTAWLPSLIEHRCGIGERGGFLERLRDGTWAGHILEHVMIELQNLAGIPSGFGKARETARRGVYKVVVRTPDETVGRAALHAARELIMAAIDDRPCDVAALVDHLRTVAAPSRLGASTQCIVDAATERRIPYIRLNEGNLIQLGYGARQQRIWAAETIQTGAIAETIAAKRALSANLLRAVGLPVAESRLVDDAAEAWEAAQELDLPVVVTAAERHAHRCIGPLTGREEIEAAFHAMAAQGVDVIVEQTVTGQLHRLLVVGGRMVAAARRDASVTDVTEHVHPDTAEAARLAARVIGLDIAGVDIIATDIALPLSAQGGAVIGVNARPDLTVHARPDDGAARPVGAAVCDYLFPSDDSGRIPLVGIAGSHGTTLVARLVARLLHARGTYVGLACGDGVYLNARQIERGDGSNWASAQRVLMNRNVEAAVIETSNRTILSSGLGYDRCAVGVVTGIDPADTLPEYFVDQQSQLFNVVRTQVDVVLPDGCAVLNAADAQVVEMAALCDGEVMFFGRSANLPALAAHCGRGGRAVFVRDGRIVLAGEGREHAIAGAAALPLANLAELEAVLAAAGAAWALGMTPQQIGAELAVFLDELRAAYTAAVQPVPAVMH